MDSDISDNFDIVNTFIENSEPHENEFETTYVRANSRNNQVGVKPRLLPMIADDC